MFIFQQINLFLIIRDHARRKEEWTSCSLDRLGVPDPDPGSEIHNLFSVTFVFKAFSSYQHNIYIPGIAIYWTRPILQSASMFNDVNDMLFIYLFIA